MLWCESSKDCILLGLIDSDTYLHEFGKLVQNNVSGFIRNLVAGISHGTFWMKQPLLEHCVRVHWSFGSSVRLLCLCQHLEEMTPQTSCSSQMRPEGGAIWAEQEGLILTLRLRGGALILCCWPRIQSPTSRGCVSSDSTSSTWDIDLLYFFIDVSQYRAKYSCFVDRQTTTCL